ncbi:hypothetical protein PF005_g23141 [Phytophthora fragariae]|uniref:Retrotransposon gag domain-containing protein n=1 Tax=Phytophthora fragariae TaxID=53985 RepID=A0A6A3IRC0_9STRA|nr:hypothetical protein PF011_g21253 [Phytophthora fragariae]KAE9180769.1 hypothetical protein PF005_g23141 [Phytophthora fragariae]
MQRLLTTTNYVTGGGRNASRSDDDDGGRDKHPACDHSTQPSDVRSAQDHVDVGSSGGTVQYARGAPDDSDGSEDSDSSYRGDSGSSEGSSESSDDSGEDDSDSRQQGGGRRHQARRRQVVTTPALRSSASRQRHRRKSVKDLELSPFKPSPTVSVSTWIAKVDLALEGARVSRRGDWTDAELYYILGNKLQDNAARWWVQMDQELATDERTWTRLKAALLRRYGERPDKSAAEWRVSRRRMMPGETSRPGSEISLGRTR